MPKFEKKWPLSVQEALDQGLIEKYYSHTYKRNFFAFSGKDGFETGTQALDYYYEIHLPACAAAEETEKAEKVASGKYLVVESDKAKETCRVTTPEGVLEMTLREFRQRVFDLEEKYNMEVLHV